MAIAKRINAYLKENSITIADFSARTNASRATISSISSGTGDIDCLDYYKICKALNVDLELFLN